MKLKIYYVFFLLILFQCNSSENKEGESKDLSLDYSIDIDTLLQGHTDSTTWFYPSVGVIPGKEPKYVLAIQEWLKGRSDVFKSVVSSYSLDKGQSWTELEDPQNAFIYRSEPGNLDVGICNFTLKWHEKTQSLLGTAHTVRYRDKTLVSGLRSTIYATYDEETMSWNKWKSVEMPPEPQFYDSGACADQRVDLPNGDVLLPIYYRAKGVDRYTTSVIRCSYDGENLEFKEIGNALDLPIRRGYFEPSLAEFKGKYYLTIRNDENGYVTVSDDGLNFTEPKVWSFDNGEEIGTYNTQQHWIIHSDGLYLVYTRRGADNDHVFRHRAPLFMAEVDVDKMVLKKSTEKVVAPNRGARLGNFAITNISENETWITAAELMMGKGEEAYGAEGNVFASRILWNKPNKDWLK
ncbi:sialidase family protein [Membranihabitans marinus]|uniref:sialidase family protein n=1 Tax=Membranihabitans marinus TaxID=1227546 RepID=UPI001F1FB718|nr:sialidase family protein [Membranihabitans marinus]